MGKYIAILMCMAGCGDKSDNEPPPLNSGGNNNSCGGASPVIQTVTCENSGIVDHPDYGPLPTFTLYVNATDEDGDLTHYELFVDIDTQLNGTKDSDAQTLDPSQNSLSDKMCDVNEADVGLTIYLRTGPPEFETTYEWYVQITDALGLISEPFGVECTTPNSAGEGTP
jgi:hypothetical protein